MYSNIIVLSIYLQIVFANIYLKADNKADKGKLSERTGCKVMDL